MNSPAKNALPLQFRRDVISDKRQLLCLTNPVRQSVFDSLKNLKTASAAQIGDQLGSPADVVNYHLKKLKEVELVKQVGLRGEGRKAERTFELTNPRAKVRFDPSDAENVEVMNKAVRSLLALSQKDFSRAFNPRDAVTAGPNRSLRVSRLTAWLTKQEWAEVNRLIEEINRRLSSGTQISQRDTNLYAVSIVTAPVAAQPVKRRR